PWNYKTQNGVKGLLKDAYSDLIPYEVLYRKKTPYPKTYNPAFENELKYMLREILRNGSPLNDLINIEFLESLFESTSETETPWFGQLMKKPQVYAYLIQIDFWLKEYEIEIII
ncbi:MAG: asparagine synthase-related protein, partial [Clostridia bacterium]